LLVLVCLVGLVFAAKPARKNWLSLSQTERDEFTGAVNLLKESGVYDEYVRLHEAAYNTPCPWGEEDPDIKHRNGDQKGPAFLPWHREQLLLLERDLQRVSNNSALTIPYWNYVEDGRLTNPTLTPMWSPLGIGSNGRKSDNRVVDGPFKNWPLKYSTNGEKYLTRTLGAVYTHPSTPQDLSGAMMQITYDAEPWSANSAIGFRNWVEGFYSARGAADPLLSMHANAHAFVGGAMTYATSPNDPVFFLVHSYTDALWAAWQMKQLGTFPGSTYLDHFAPHRGGPVGHNLDDELIGLGGATARDVLDFSAMPYTYDQFL